MSKNKRYYVTHTKYRLIEAYAENKEEALDIVKNNTTGGLAGTPDQKGFNTMWLYSKDGKALVLEDYSVSDEAEEPS